MNQQDVEACPSCINIHYSWANWSGERNAERKYGPNLKDIAEREPGYPGEKANPAYSGDCQGRNNGCAVPRVCLTSTFLEGKDQ